MSIEAYYAAFNKISSQIASMVPKPSFLCTTCTPAWTARETYDAQDTMFDFVMVLRITRLPKKCGITCRVATNKAAQPFAIHFVRIFSSRTCQLRSTMLPSTRYQVKLPPWYPSLHPCAPLVLQLGLPGRHMIRRTLCLIL